MYSMVMEFEWHEPKRQSNLARHKIDFQDAKEIWHGNVLEVPSAQTQHGAQRSIAYGVGAGRSSRGVFTWRDSVRRWTSARRARTQGRKIYRDRFGEGR